MLIECKLRRYRNAHNDYDGTKVELGKRIYYFKPSDEHEGAHVCEVKDRKDVATLLHIKSAYQLYGTEPEPESDSPTVGRIVAPKGQPEVVTEFVDDELGDLEEPGNPEVWAEAEAAATYADEQATMSIPELERAIGSMNEDSLDLVEEAERDERAGRNRKGVFELVAKRRKSDVETGKTDAKSYIETANAKG